MNRIFQIPVISAFLLSVVACESMLDVDLPSDQLTIPSVFADSSTVKASANALYTENFYMNPVYYYLIPYYTCVMSDEATHNVVSLEVFNQNSYEESTAAVANIWTYAYNSVFLSNSLIERLEETTVISRGRKERFISEAKYFRAYNYFVLVNFYGDVPLVLSTDYKQTMFLPREDTGVIYSKIITDLEEAEREIGEGNTSNTKVTKAAVTALLARAYLYTGKYAEAEQKATDLITNTAFELEEPGNVFLRQSRETILRMQDFRTSYLGRTYWGGYLCRLANYNRLREEFSESFEEGDQRKAVWTGQISNRAYYQSTKYKQASNPSNSDLAEDHVFLRLAEQYLIRAEARAQQDKDGAVEDLNTIRDRASLDALPLTLSKTEILLAVEKERRAELFSEEGHRWWDLKRMGRIDEVLGRIADKKWESYRALWPVPEAQLNANQNLVQNPGYGTIN